MPYDYRAAIESTEDVIHRRARLYRIQVIVVGVFLCSVVVAAALYELRLFAGLALIVPLCGGFLVADATVVHRWRTELLSAWTRVDIDFMALRQAVNAHPRLPPGTLSGMLEGLPGADSLTAEQAIGASARADIAADRMTRASRERHVLVVKVALTGALALLAVAAVLTRG